MNNKDRRLIEKIIGYCTQIKTACDMFHNDEAQFTEGSVFQNACCMCLLQIGELAGKLSDDARNEASDMPWREIRAMRNICAHNYGSIDKDTVWDTIRNDIPKMKDKCEEMIR